MNLKLISINRYILILPALILLCILTQGTALASGKPVGMILEKKGTPKIKYGGKVKKAYLMRPLYADSVIITGKGSALTFVSYLDRCEYRVEPESEVTLEESYFITGKGRLARIDRGEAIPLPKNTVLVSRKILGAVGRAYRREFGILKPQADTVFAEPAISFAWQKGKTAQYEVIIIEKGTLEIKNPFPLTVGGTSWTYKSDSNSQFQLQYGKTYYFVVKEKYAETELKKIDGSHVFENFDKVTFCLLDQGVAEKVIDAGKKYKAAMEKNPDDLKAMLLMADFYKENGMYCQAAGVLKKMKEKDSENPYVYYYLADMLDKSGGTGGDAYRQRGIILEEKNQ